MAFIDEFKALLDGDDSSYGFKSYSGCPETQKSVLSKLGINSDFFDKKDNTCKVEADEPGRNRDHSSEAWESKTPDAKLNKLN